MDWLMDGNLTLPCLGRLMDQYGYLHVFAVNIDEMQWVKSKYWRSCFCILLLRTLLSVFDSLYWVFIHDWQACTISRCQSMVGSSWLDGVVLVVSWTNFEPWRLEDVRFPPVCFQADKDAACCISWGAWAARCGILSSKSLAWNPNPAKYGIVISPLAWVASPLLQVLLLSGLCLCVSFSLRIWRLEDLRDVSEIWASPKGLGFHLGWRGLPWFPTTNLTLGLSAAGSWRFDPVGPVCSAGCLVHPGGHYIIPGGLSLHQTRTAVPLWILGPIRWQCDSPPVFESSGFTSVMLSFCSSPMATTAC